MIGVPSRSRRFRGLFWGSVGSLLALSASQSLPSCVRAVLAMTSSVQSMVTMLSFIIRTSSAYGSSRRVRWRPCRAARGHSAARRSSQRQPALFAGLGIVAVSTAIRSPLPVPGYNFTYCYHYNVRDLAFLNAAHTVAHAVNFRGAQSQRTNRVLTGQSRVYGFFQIFFQVGRGLNAFRGERKRARRPWPTIRERQALFRASSIRECSKPPMGRRR